MDDNSDEDHPAQITPERKRPPKLRRLANTVQLTLSGRISILKPEWMDASPDNPTFIQDWNSCVKNHETSKHLVAPTGTTLVPTDGESTKEQRIRRQVDQLSSKVKTPEMKEKDAKKIDFNLQSQFPAAKVPINDDDLE
jgi:hypothetical protein